MEVKAEIVEGRIALWVPWDGGRGKDRAKSIPGARPQWDKTVTPNRFLYWHYPLAMSTAVAMRKEFGASLVLGPKLTAWGWEERRNTEELEKLRAGSDADLPGVRERAPALWSALENRPFQITGAAFITKGKRVCLGDEPRLGKTYQALAAMVEADAALVLIACPRTATRTVWMRKINELAPHYMPFVAQGPREQREQVMQAFLATPYRYKVLIINKEMVRVVRWYRCKKPPNHPGSQVWQRPGSEHWESRTAPGRKGGCQDQHDHTNIYVPEYSFLYDVVWDAVILDECHHLLASEKNIQSKDITQGRMGAVKLRVKDDGLKIGLSGTPFRSKLTKSWGVLNWMRPDVFSSFWRYAETLFEVTSSGYGGAKVIGRLRSEEVLQDTLRPYYLVRTKAEVAPWLPRVEHIDVMLPMEDKQNEAYTSILKDACAYLEDGSRINANGILAELTRLRQFACAWGRLSGGDFYPALPSNKIDWILQYIEEMWEIPERKVVIASGFTKLVHAIADALRGEKYPALLLTGGTNDAGREHAQDEFLNGKARIIVINTFAGGEAIDLSSADDLILVDEPWNTDAREQVMNRIQNLAKKNQVTIHHLRSEGTIDETIADMNDDQLAKLLSANPQVVKEVLGK
jgi:SNF2 family DNA or RNA helicase